MHSSLEEIENTLFLIPPGYPEGIVDNLPHKIYVADIIRPRNRLQHFMYKKWWLRWIYLKIKRRLIFQNVSSCAKIYAQDHLYHSETIIGNNKYTIIEDSSKIFTKISQNPTYFENRFWKHKKSRGFFLKKILFGPTLYGAFARNCKCAELLLSVPDDDCFIKHIPQTICDFNKEWETCSEKKKKLIKNIYNITKEDIDNLRSCTCIIFTQNIYSYGSISKEKQIAIYKRIAEKYPNERIVIKPHPVDTLKYEEYIPNVLLFRKNIPSQLMTMVGIRFNRLVTLFSSAVLDLPYNAIIDWYGSEVDTELFNKIGPMSIPNMQKNVNINYCKL